MWPIFWATIFVWTIALVAIIIKPINVMALKLVGASALTEQEWRLLYPAWQTLDGIIPNWDAYDVLVVDQDMLIPRDLGFYVVTVDRSALYSLNKNELRAVLVWRFARQANWTAPLTGLCLWGALPLLLMPGLGLLIFRTIREVVRAVKTTADGLNPKTEFQAGCGLLLYGVGMVGLLAMLIAGLWFLIEAVFVLVVSIILAGLIRRAGLTASIVATRLGYGDDLMSALMKLIAFEQPKSSWLKPLSTYSSLNAHFVEIERVASLDS